MTEPQHLGKAVVAFALEGTFPDDITSFPPVSTTELGPAIEILEKTKTELEVGLPVPGGIYPSLYPYLTHAINRQRYTQ